MVVDRVVLEDQNGQVCVKSQKSKIKALARPGGAGLQVPAPGKQKEEI